MPHARTRNSRPTSGDPSTRLSLRVRAEHDDAPAGLDRAQAEDLGLERTDLTGWEVRHGDDLATRQVLLRVPLADRNGTLLDPERSEVDPELVRRIPRLGEVLHLDDVADPHFDLSELFDRDRRHGPRPRGTGSVDLRLSARRMRPLPTMVVNLSV